MLHLCAALALGAAFAIDGVGPAAHASDALALPPDPARIVGGSPTSPGEFDSVVAVLVGNRICTGTVVADNLVLTAAHCFTSNPSTSSIHVAYGESISGQRVVDAKAYGVHPNYTGESDGHDVYDFAYVLVEGRFSFGGGFILPLSEQDEWDESMRIGEEVMLVGFGESSGDDAEAGRKRKVVTTISRFTSSGLEFYAGGSGRDSCSGDSGGPAFVKLTNGKVRLAGILSRGSDPCGDGGYYGVPYAALGWVHAETGINMLPPGCEEADCLDTRPLGQGGCSIGRSSSPTATAFVLAALGVIRRRRRRR